MAWILNKSDLAEALGVANKTVGVWIKRGCPCEPDPQDPRQWAFEIPKVLEWLYGEKPSLAVLNKREAEESFEEERKAEVKEGQLDPNLISSDYQKARKDAAHADKLEMENALRRSELIEVNEAKAAWSKVAAAIRAGVMALSSRVSEEVVALNDFRKVKARIDQEVHEILEELSEDDLSD